MTMREHIQETLQNGLQPSHLVVIDDSASHAGHAGARGGGGHFDLTVVSALFHGKSLLQRHRMINGLLAKELQGAIHALSMNTLTPEEWMARQG